MKELKEFLHTIFDIDECIFRNQMWGREEHYRKNNKMNFYYLLVEQTSFLPPEASIKERIFCILHDIDTLQICPVCNVVPLKFYKKNYMQYCGTKCSANSPKTVKLRESTCLELYGATNIFGSKTGRAKLEEVWGGSCPAKKEDVALKISSTKLSKSDEEKASIREKREFTTMERYGYAVPFENVDAIKKTKFKKYGDENFSNREKAKYTNKERYGVEYAVQHPSVRNKSKLSKQASYFDLLCQVPGITPLFSSNEYVETYNRKCKCHQCEQEFTIESWMDQVSQIRCPICFPYKKTKAENEILLYIKSILPQAEVISNSFKIIAPKQLDLYVPEHKLAIEYDGLFWHSKNTVEDDNDHKKYHLLKTEECAAKGIRLFHIFENEWQDETKQEIWKGMIKAKLGLNTSIGARTCEVKEISSKIANTFHEKNHLQGSSTSSRNYGLYHSGILVSVLSVGRSRFNKNHDFEIHRYSSVAGLSISGGFSKLLNAFRLDNKGSIITYADKRFSTGDVYTKSGFVELHDSSPNYWYFNHHGDKKLYSRIQFQKHKLKDKLEIFDETLTEAENMFANGWRRIWDCGNKVFTLE